MPTTTICDRCGGKLDKPKIKRKIGTYCESCVRKHATIKTVILNEKLSTARHITKCATIRLIHNLILKQKRFNGKRELTATEFRKGILNKIYDKIKNT